MPLSFVNLLVSNCGDLDHIAIVLQISSETHVCLHERNAVLAAKVFRHTKYVLADPATFSALVSDFAYA